MALTTAQKNKLNRMNEAARQSSLGTLLGNLEDGVLGATTPGTVEANKAVIAGANKNVDVLAIADLKLGAGAGTSVTSTAAELNILDGVTATAAELNLVDGSVAGTAVASKALALGADKNVDVLAIADLKLGAGAGTSVTSTAAELNILDGVTSSAAELNLLDGVTSNAASLSGLQKISETVLYSQFTDGGGAAGTFATAMQIPIGATFLYSAVPAVTGFAGDTSAVMTIGDGSDADRYNTGTLNVFADAANGVAAGDPSGVRYHDAAKTVTLTVTGNADFTSISAGSVTVEMFYLT